MESTFDPGAESSAVSFASTTFTGLAVYVECLLSISNSTWDSDLSFFIDERLVGTFSSVASSPPWEDSSMIVFSKTDLSMGQHTITIQNGHENGRRSSVVLDSVIYTQDHGPQITHKAVIAIAVVISLVGALLVSALAFCLWRCCRRPNTTQATTEDVPIAPYSLDKISPVSETLPYIDQRPVAAESTQEVSPLKWLSSIVNEKSTITAEASHELSLPPSSLATEFACNVEAPTLAGPLQYLKDAPEESSSPPTILEHREAAVFPVPLPATEVLEEIPPVIDVERAQSLGVVDACPFNVDTGTLSQGKPLGCFEVPVHSLQTPYVSGATSLPLNGIFGPNLQPIFLIQSHFHATIVDTSAQVCVTQTYWNCAAQVVDPTSYFFHAPPEIKVCEFAIIKTSGEVITHSFDVQRIDSPNPELVFPIGRLAASETVEVKLLYVATLMNDDNADEIRLRLPYQLASVSNVGEGSGVKIDIDIQTSGRLHNISVDSAHVQDTVTSSLTDDSPRRAKLRYTSGQALDRDFFVIVHADGLDAPRCVVESSTASPDTLTQIISCQLSLVMKFSSMMGPAIQAAKDTLTMLLKLLPAQNTMFNIITFASDSQVFSSTSLTYNDASLEHAINYISMVGVEVGTNIQRALESAFQFYNKNTPTSIFLITDGNDPYDKVTSVERAVRLAPSIAPMRVFVLGIGLYVDQESCKKIAIAGNGDALFTMNAEGIMGKCARLLQASQNQYLRDVVLDWGVPHTAYQQSPEFLPEIHAGTRLNVYASLTVDHHHLLTKVYLRGLLGDTGEPFQLELPVDITKTPDGNSQIHRVVSWKLGHSEPSSGQRNGLPSHHDAFNIPISRQVLDLINLQRYNGSFSLDSPFRRMIGEVGNPLGVDSGAWATALAVAFLQKQVPAHRELWVKPYLYLTDLPDYERVLACAVELFT
ncbi:hypothetical protein ONZ45_g2607 [Pleurotus djamor]|nr:hypothetical protein ONZ45_g2607 [Pleurotus djamor]